jgi:hypothetical protein
LEDPTPEDLEPLIEDIPVYAEPQLTGVDFIGAGSSFGTDYTPPQVRELLPSDRLLGQTRMLVLPNRATWIATANNPQLSLEIARRCIRIRLDPKPAR